MLHKLHIVRNIFVVIILFACCITANAQRRYFVGYVKDSATKFPIINATITNETSHAVFNSDKKGFFRVTAVPGDLLFFEAKNYHYKIYHTSLMMVDTLVIYLASNANQLASVTVSTKGYSQYQKDSIKRREEFMQDVGPKMKTVSGGNSGVGAGLNLDPFLSKKGKEKREAYKFFEQNEQDRYVDYRFSREIVGQYTLLTGDTLTNFMWQYRPSYKWLRDHQADDDVFFYINEKMKEFVVKKQE
jgi:hypothetical protein